MLSLECRKELSNATETDKFQIYQKLCEKFKPVFHHFFLERFPEPPQVIKINKPFVV